MPPYWVLVIITFFACNAQTFMETGAMVTSIRNFDTERYRFWHPAKPSTLYALYHCDVMSCKSPSAHCLSFGNLSWLPAATIHVINSSLYLRLNSPGTASSCCHLFSKHCLLQGHCHWSLEVLLGAQWVFLHYYLRLLP